MLILVSAEIAAGSSGAADDLLSRLAGRAAFPPHSAGYPPPTDLSQAPLVGHAWHRPHRQSSPTTLARSSADDRSSSGRLPSTTDSIWASIVSRMSEPVMIPTRRPFRVTGKR